MNTICAISLVLLAAVAARAESPVVWKRHAWSLPAHVIIQEMFLSYSVFRELPEPGPMSARYYGDGFQKGVALVLSNDSVFVVTGVAEVDLIDAYNVELSGDMGFRSLRSLAEVVEQRGQVRRNRRLMEEVVGQRVFSIWQNVSSKCAFSPISEYHALWSMHVRFGDGRVLEFDVSDASPRRPVKELIEIANALIDFAEGRVGEDDVLRISIAAQARIDDMPSFPIGVFR